MLPALRAKSDADRQSCCDSRRRLTAFLTTSRSPAGLAGAGWGVSLMVASLRSVVGPLTALRAGRCLAAGGRIQWFASALTCVGNRSTAGLTIVRQAGAGALAVGDSGPPARAACLRGVPTW